MDQSNHPVSEPVSTPDHVAEVTPEPVAAPRGSRRRLGIAIIIGLAIFAIIAGFLVVKLTSPSHRPAASVPATTPASTAVVVQTDDLTTDLNSASKAVDQSATDQQAADTSLNDSNNQVAVPTE